MDRDSPQSLTAPLSTAEAKARLRLAAQNVTFGALIGKQTWPLMAVAVAGGFVAARLRLPAALGSIVIQRFAPILLSVLLGKKRTQPDSPDDSSESSLKSK